MTSSALGQGQLHQRDDGPFVLKSLLDDVPLSADGSQSDVKINCVDYYDHNLYVGTSASELLHFVQIPPDPNERSARPVYILASRLGPYYAEPSGGFSGTLPGVQQILILPRAGKACIRCNWTVTFYSLPELSPAYGNKKLKNCNHIGGVDLNEPLDAGHGEPAAQTVLVSMNKMIQAIRIGEAPRIAHDIPLPGSTLSVRRDSIACVADSKSYSLLDVERQLRIPLMSISSQDESPPPGEIGHAQTLPVAAAGGVTRSNSSVHARPSSSAHGHGRSTSLGGAILKSVRPDRPAETEEAEMPDPGLSMPSPSPSDTVASPSVDKPLPQPPSRTGTPSQTTSPRPEPKQVFLKPHIASPTPEEFLIIRGTSPIEPCIGMFVNLDGDPTRAPISFSRYPKDVVVDGGQVCMTEATSALQEDDDGFVIASLAKETPDGLRHGLDIQSLDADRPESDRHWLEAEGVERGTVYGIKSLTGSEETELEDIVLRLCQKRYTPFSKSPAASTLSLKSADSRTDASMERLSKERELFERDDSQDRDSLPEGWESSHKTEAEDFARRLAKAETKLAVWAGRRIWWAMRNPLVVRYDSVLEAACPGGYAHPQKLDRRAVVNVLGAVRRRDARSELEFLTFGYLRQKVSLLLLTSLLRTPTGEEFTDTEMNALEEVLIEGSLDPRVVLSLIPGVRNEIIEGRRGIWIYGGVKQAADTFRHTSEFERTVKDAVSTLGPRVLHFLRRFLTSWRGMKGLPSISDESEVFRTVDAALLLVLLELDRSAPPSLGARSAVRRELYEVVDKGVECFDRAVDLLESYHRLYVLSRLYQSRRMAAEVLGTWKRIIEGERDDGNEFEDGEQTVRKHLARIRNQSLIQEYGVWLANRNPKLGVQVFTEDNGKTARFEPNQVVELLKAEAPNAVKYYLEHLVLDKGHTAYVNDLISYYLDVVVDGLGESRESRDAVMATYDAYRALSAPKPTYRHFLTDNAPPEDEVYHSRLRLLQLLSGAHDYDAGAIRKRIAGLSADLLVPETIILSGRERNHKEALRLLVHQLGDYDTAVAYCLRGGTSIDSFSTPAGRGRAQSLPSVAEQRRLFHAVLHEFLAIADVSDRVEQTGGLLERFGGWFEIDDVLDLIPDNWSVDVVAGFLVGALRRLVTQRREVALTRALSGAENLRISYDLVCKTEEKGPSIEAQN
ncbi:Transforming growth factor-beta receptor-associated protein-like protein [Emericellopsis cladophorae]|uniref:Transforming growth factor-beta receptor-associated protein-like protein n=1 Tax=Emericellopsis cladophorae TaxID=2686198 RepID=A0A9P9Y3Z7_9HYPO|nr:Transforming growth factor-beta receptor-associated protein-like protein [Emericellopsis cladophorae]KAI6783208.1 Transforming growth factor-beta receptor-associated protein-like protein [Emericellopsis cladophorae]